MENQEENKKLGKDVPKKEKDKNPETDSNEIELYDLPDRDLKLTIINILTKIKRKMNEQMIISTEILNIK